MSLPQGEKSHIDILHFKEISAGPGNSGGTPRMCGIRCNAMYVSIAKDHLRRCLKRRFGLIWVLCRLKFCGEECLILVKENKLFVSTSWPD
jgi:hypothetical protein